MHTVLNLAERFSDKVYPGISGLIFYPKTTEKNLSDNCKNNWILTALKSH
jgi:hypothetical protein